jgi:DnaJ homolog subfamily C member 7
MPALPNLFTKSPKKKSPNVSSPQDSSNTPPSSPEKRSAGKSSRDSKRTPATSSKPSKSSFSRSSSARYDPDTHPLNLPPDERSKRLSALSGMSDQGTPMEVDRELTASPVPTSPVNGTNVPAPKVNGAQRSSEEDSRPAPPPHRTPTSPPPQPSKTPASPPPARQTGNPLPQPPQNEVQAEEFKKAGNKFYTSKDYDRAIAEYSKG